jgi:hypothetical protein
VEFTKSRFHEENFLPNYTPPGWSQVSPGVWEIDRSETARLIVAKAGLVGRLADRLLFRADFYWSARHVLPNTGVTAGVGFRF